LYYLENQIPEQTRWDARHHAMDRGSPKSSTSRCIGLWILAWRQDP
jgi:hypothetical protein